MHDKSRRASQAFIPVNCGALPENLVESELFGHRRGAFTGADTHRKGLFEVANGGTLFLDEVGELDKSVQGKLLRFLESGEIQRIGGNETMRVDVRIVAATHQPLKQRTGEDAFRLDLYHRLAVFPVRVPALRERPEDIPLLVRHFVQQFSRRLGRTIDAIPAETMSALTRYPWPGNIRELQNVI